MSLGLVFQAVLAAEHQPERIKVGYFEQWPSPALFSRAKQTYDRALGIPLEWVAYPDGAAMNRAMAAGELQIALSQGHTSFLVGISEGLELTAVGIAVVYPEDDNCVVKRGAGITRDNAARLAGQNIATVGGGVTHFRLLRLLERLGVDPAAVEILEYPDAAGAAAALRAGASVMACTFGSALRGLADIAEPLLEGAELQQMGLPLFDLITVTGTFLDDHPDLVQTFMDVTTATNAQWRRNPDPMRAVIARAAGMDRASSDAALARFGFPSVAEQKSDAWLGETVPRYLRELAVFLVKQNRLRKAQEHYDGFVSSRFLR